MTDQSPRDSDLSVHERRAKERKVWRTALLVSVLFHLLIFVSWHHKPVVLSPFAAAGPRAGDNRAAAGSMQSMNVRTPPSVPVVPPPVPVPTIDPVPPVEFEEKPDIEPAQMAGQSGTQEGPGLDEGTGQGDGGTAAEGFFRLTPPNPRGMIIPPADKSLKGEEVEVWVFVNEQGRVVPDSTWLEPPTDDKDFNRRLIREASEWTFTPAMKGGEPVATWFPYRISM